MADINVDVNLPSVISVDITSPTQVLATNISIPGPQGPTGPSGIVNTGQFDLRYYSISNPSGFISGNLDLYATAINLASTGANLNTSINSLSGLFTGYTGSLDATYATDSQLANTGTTLVNSINSLSGTLTSNYATINNLALTGSNLNTKIDNFSGTYQNFVDNLDSSYATDVQLQNTGSTLSQNINNLSGTLTSNYATITNLASTGSTLVSSVNSLSSAFTGFTGNLDATYATDSQLATTGTTLVNSISSLSGTLTSNYATITNLASTGSTLVNTISSLSGTLTSNYATINNLNSTGSTLETSIASTGNTLNLSINSLSGTLTSTYATITNLASTGSTLNNSINSLSGTLTSTYATINNLASTGSTLATNLASTGLNLDTKINALSGSSVLLYGDQSVGGVKTFRDNVYINNLFVTGAQTVVSTNNFSVQSPYLLLNLTGGAVDGGIFFVTGSGLTGVNDNGPIIGFDHSNKFKFGISTRNSDLSTLPDIASFQDITAYSGFVDGKYATIINLASTGSTLSTNLASTGSTLQTNINNLSNTYATITNLGLTGSTLVTNLASTGSTLNTKINNLSGYVNSTGSNIVFTTGNQTISGDKIFKNNIVIEQTGIFSAIDLSDTDSILLSGIDIQITSGSMTLTSPPTISGNPFITGNLSLYSTITNLASTGSTLTTNLANTGSTLVSSINSLSGTLTGNYGTITNLASTGNTLEQKISSLSGTLTSTYATITNLASTGSTLATNLANTGATLQTNINNLSGYINSSSSNIVFNTGNQFVDGLKSITQSLYLNNINEPKTLFSYDFNTMINQTGASVAPSFDLQTNVISAGNMTRSTGISGFLSTVGWGATSFSINGSTVELAINNYGEYYTIPISSNANQYYWYGAEIYSINPLLVIRSPAGPKSMALMYGPSANPAFATVIDSGINIIPVANANTDISPVFNQSLKNNKIKLTPSTNAFLFLVPYQATGNGGTLRFVTQGGGADLAFKGLNFGSNFSDSSLKINTDVNMLGKLDLNKNKLVNSIPETININSNFTITDAYNGRIVLTNSETTTTGILVAGIFSGFNMSIIQGGVGKVEITTSYAPLTSLNSFNNQFKTAGRFANVSLLNTGNDGYILYGNTSV